MDTIYGLSEPEASALLTTFDGQLDTELSRAEGVADWDCYYLLQDGRVLLTHVHPAEWNTAHDLPKWDIGLIEQGEKHRIVSAVLYASRQVAREAHDEYLRVLAEPGGPQHTFAGMLPTPEVFLSHIPEYVENLSRYLSLPEQVLNKTPESLDAVETTILRIGIKRFYEEADLFTALTAYLGEVARSLVQGEWGVIWALDESPNPQKAHYLQGVWMPIIVDKQNRKYHQLIDLRMQFFEYWREPLELKRLFSHMTPTLEHSTEEIERLQALLAHISLQQQE